MARILAVEDDPAIQALIAMALTQRGHEITQADDTASAMAEYRRVEPDLVVLDLWLRRGSGFEVCRQIRAVGRTPILIVTSSAAEEDEVAGLQLGADDFLRKPFSSRVLQARVEALLRRAADATTAPVGQIAVADLEIDLPRAEARIGKVRLDLTPTEFRLLSHLAANAGQVIRSRDLLLRAQDYDASDWEAQRIVKVHIKRLRDKWEQAVAQESPIVSVRGFGYMLRLDD